MLDALVTIGLFYVALVTGLEVLVLLEPSRPRHAAGRTAVDELSARRRPHHEDDEHLPLSA